MILLIVCAFSPIDHDEGQYVGAVAMMRHGLPYRDFAYLQTPLQPLLFAPLAWIASGSLFPALRAVNALIAAGAILGIWFAARRAGASPYGAVLAAVALASSHMLLFAGSVARNDALPLLLMTAGLAMFLRLLNTPRRQWMALAAGVLLGGAASAKISYGLPAAASGLFALLHWRTLGPLSILLLAIGGMVGGLPTAWLAWQAPDAAWFGIIDYSLKAPAEWRMLNGQASMMAWPLSLLRLLRFLAQGCGLIALVAVLLALKRARSPVEWLLDMMIVAGLMAAWLPRPIYIQYLGPLLPPLFIRFALLAQTPFWQRSRGRALMGIGVIAGIAQTGIHVGTNMVNGHSPVLTVARDAVAMNRLLPHGRAAGIVATLSPERVVDSRLTLDRRFVTGPFLFRTRSIMTDAHAHAFHTITFHTLTARLDAQPPAAIVVGGQSKPGRLVPQGLDVALERWARSRNYRAIALPSGTSTLFLPAVAPAVIRR